MESKKILVIGAGVGGISQAFELRDALRRKVETYYEKLVLQFMGVEKIKASNQLEQV